MYRPMLIILGIGILAGVAVGFLVNSFNPMIASSEIKFLFLASAGIIVVSLATLIFYALAVVWREDRHYLLFKYFGPELPYFKTIFRRAFLLGTLGLVLFALRRFGFFTVNFAGGGTAIIIIIEMLLSAHERQIKIAKS